MTEEPSQGCHINSTASPRSSPRIIVGICSAIRYPKRRMAVRDTWLRELPAGMSAFFFVGDATKLQELDVIQFDAPDDYDHLPLKMQMFFRHLTEHHEFDYAFKCDDDTYLRPERLLAFAKSVEVDFVGDAALKDRWAQGGAGYLMTRKIVESLACATMPESGPEDLIVSKIIKGLGATYLASNRLRADCKRWPGNDTNYITAHHCSPSRMRYIHDWINRPEEFAVVSSYHARHRDWERRLTLRKNGTFFLGDSTFASGTWEVPGSGEHLVLRWFRWQPESLMPTATGFAGASLELVLISSPDEVALL